jgi:anti-anti-sigma factor
MPASINIETHHVSNGVVYIVTGEVDLATSPEIDNQLDFEEAGTIVVLDLADVSFIDSTGLRVIVTAHDDAEASGKELRVVAGAKVRRLLEITGLQARLAVYDDRTAAIADG